MAHIKPELASNRAIYGTDYEHYILLSYICALFENNIKCKELELGV